MIITKLQGGLGNQMFQYAMGFALARHMDVPLYYDSSWFNESFDPAIVTPRSFALDIFRLSGQPADAAMVKQFFPTPHWPDKIWHRLKRILGTEALLYEQQPGYDKIILAKARKNSYLQGYWQSAAYFSNVELALRQEFQFVEQAASPYTAQIAAAALPVAIHVRRGDYAHNAATQSIHGLLTPAYYQQGIALLQQALGNGIDWFIFSDDPTWCSAAFASLPNHTIVDSSSYPHWYDMQLMSTCKHHIIANSSYSWWGAWLAAHATQLVVAPAQWCATMQAIPQHMHPAHWETI
ncbi:alpha-1,2-fucosyltransferase [Phnomibacter ginsenosidimutans]|uniref:Alpha-1,2-fucosyltransferase n=1 Tax=Phnomibacter ginsenosidimutans TaxID=2676868 RepID=A0A6I6GA67_9BACT|nr:alpha-1,2-fucosyltransferase [Phnomibacter ginsenosidimutans]QGW29716.1 hypothetical protein GLV81_17760 [Phnomibacter ginsenosidimutans]